MEPIKIISLESFTITALCYIERLLLGGLKQVRLPEEFFTYQLSESKQKNLAQWLRATEEIFCNQLEFVPCSRKDIEENDVELPFVKFIDNNYLYDIDGMCEISNNVSLRLILSNIWDDYIAARYYYTEQDFHTQEKKVSIKNGYDITYYVLDNQKKTTIVITCAIYTSYKIWNPLIDLLKQHFRIILCEYKDSKLEICELADVINEIVKAEDIDSFVMLSWCSGFKTALKYITLHPGMVTKWIIIAGNFSSMINKHTVLTDFEKNLVALADVLLSSKKILNIKSMLNLIMPDNVYKDTLSKKLIWGVPTYLREMTLKQFDDYEMLQQYLSMFIRYQNYDFVVDLKNVNNVPIINMLSEVDIISDVHNDLFVQEILPNIRTIMIPLTSHWGLFENSHLYVDVIQKILHIR